MLPESRTTEPWDGLETAVTKGVTGIGVGVVGQEVGRIDRRRRVLGGRGSVVDGVGCVVGAGDVDVTVALSVPPLPSLMSKSELSVGGAAVFAGGREGDECRR